jgi:hypothetical protein
MTTSSPTLLPLTTPTGAGWTAWSCRGCSTLNQETTCARNRGRDRTSQQLWVALEEQFLDNCEDHALHLDT